MIKTALDMSQGLFLLSRGRALALLLLGALLLVNVLSEVDWAHRQQRGVLQQVGDAWAAPFARDGRPCLTATRSATRDSPKPHR